MTIAEALSIPKGMNFEEYGKLLKKQNSISKKISRISDDIHFEEYSLEILEDEKGSERYNRHLSLLHNAKSKLNKAYEEYEIIEKKLKGE